MSLSVVLAKAGNSYNIYVPYVVVIDHEHPRTDEYELILLLLPSRKTTRWLKTPAV